MGKIIKYVFLDILQRKIILAYTLFLLLVSLSFFQSESNPGKAMVSLLNVVLIVLPLISLIFSTIHFYNSYEFIELLLAQPMQRSKILLSEFAGVAASLLLAFVTGIGLPLFWFVPHQPTAWALLFSGCSLTLIFVSLSFLASVMSRDKATGIGIALLLWLYFSLIYDGLVLSILFAFSDYPLERIMILLASLNPVDLGRIFVLLQMDISALMGYTGAIYKNFLGTGTGILFTAVVMLFWIVLPLWLSVVIFVRKDL